MSGVDESLPVGWRPGPFASALACAAALLAAALLIHFEGLGAGLALLAAAGATAFALWQDARLDGPLLCLRGGLWLGRRRTASAHAIAGLEYRRSLLPPRLAMRHTAQGVILRAFGRRADVEAFRQVAMWLIVHGRRQARIDPALLDALAAMPDHARADQPHDASHA
ncbi:MAG: hypothetical protein ACOY37_12355 [Pseudomonadota bacterium]